MGCRKGWSREVLDSFCLITWLDKDYKHHRQQILLDRERSRLPAAQIIIERQKEAKVMQPEIDALFEEYQRIMVEGSRIYAKYTQAQNRQAALARGEIIAENGLTTKSTDTEKRIFVMPCPAAACRGFLSTAYKCGVCDMYTCPDCREVKGLAKDSPHTCDPNTVETVRALKKECRNCPECGANIFRIHGCSQMFCTQCHTAFDWNSGKKVTHGAIHNPHYFDYVRQLNGGQMPRAAGDIPCGDGLPNAWTLDNRLRSLTGATKEEDTVLRKARQIVWTALNTFQHLNHYEIPRHTNAAEDTDNTEYNVRFLKGELNETQWKQILQTREKRRMRRDEVRQRIEAICGAASDIYAAYMTTSERLYNESKTSPKAKQESIKVLVDLMKQIEMIREIFNKEMHALSYRYRCQIFCINDDFRLGKQKASRSKKAKVDAAESDDDEDMTVQQLSTTA